MLIIPALLMLASSPTLQDRYQHTISSRAEFDRLSRTYYQGRFYAMPHLMFVIDRSANERVYFVNSNRYSFHNEFVNANYLTLERGREFFRRNYIEANRRFILGTIAYQKKISGFTFEFWEGDMATPEIVLTAYRALSAGFYTNLQFKPNSAHQKAAARKVPDVPVVSDKELDIKDDYLPLNLARNVGVLRIIDRVSEQTIIDRNEIVIFREPPITLTPLSGIITTSFSTPLAHVNLLAKGWGIPNAFIKNADELFGSLEGRFVYFETGPEGYTLRPADTAEAAEYGRRLAERSDLLTPEADLDFSSLTRLEDQRKGDSIRFGAKSANLGEIMHSVRTGAVNDITVPSGFTIPYHFYVKFIEENRLEGRILEMLGNDRFNHDPAYRKIRLKSLRSEIESGKLDEKFAASVLAEKRKISGERGVFVRSSTNSEDLPGFSGAGLYTTVPNVRNNAALLSAIKTVWASLWNYEAYEARESYGINHAAVYPAVIIQEGINAEAAGVLITTNPFDGEDSQGVYVNAKRGLGIKVVEGRRLPEQLIYDPNSGTVRVLTRSGEDTMLTFDKKGGIREVRIDMQRRVLTDDLVHRLSRAALQIEKIFGGANQDIEWVTVGERIYIVQSRPYIDN